MPKSELKTYKTNRIEPDFGDRAISRSSSICPNCHERFFYEGKAFTLTLPYRQCVHCKTLVDIPSFNEWFLMSILEKIIFLMKLSFVAVCASIVPIMLYVMAYLFMTGDGPEPSGLVIVVSFLLGMIFATGTIRGSKKRSKNKAYIKELYVSGLCNQETLQKLLDKLE